MRSRMGRRDIERGKSRGSKVGIREMSSAKSISSLCATDQTCVKQACQLESAATSLRIGAEAQFFAHMPIPLYFGRHELPVSDDDVLGVPSRRIAFGRSGCCVPGLRVFERLGLVNADARLSMESSR